MQQQWRAIIIGTSLTGKTTLVRYLRRTNNLQIQEIDEELTRLNGGNFPTDDNYKNTFLAPQIKANVFLNKNILFFSNVHYFTHSDLQIAHQIGFKIIQLFVDKEELEERNKQRMENEGYEDHSQWFDSMLQYQKEIKDKGLIDIVIETNKPVEEVAQELVAFLQRV